MVWPQSTVLQRWNAVRPMRKFNTEGPIITEDHYHVPPLERVDLDQILELIRDKRYFVMHAPR